MLIELAERRLAPDTFVRLGIRRLLMARMREERAILQHGSREDRLKGLFATGPIAVEIEAANQQHYEVPTELYRQMLGPYLKYSSCWWDESCTSLAEAEEAMLRLTCERARCRDGVRILELGCGWGSLSLWMAQEFPNSQIVAISNSYTQQAFIRQQCQQRSLSNVDVRVANVAELSLDEQFDRVVSVEMFEHMRNWQLLLRNVAQWLVSDGMCFLHTFCHRELFYPFAANGRSDWMAKHFFTGGVMPSFDVIDQLDIPFAVEQQWQVNGEHYAKTCRAWLKNLDSASDHLLEVLATSDNPADAKRQLARWRMFVMACEELFACAGGNEWFVSHTLLRRS